MSRWHAYLVSAALILTVAWPITWEAGEDSFPASNYPMFSRPLPTARVKVTYALGLEPDGTRHLISPSYIANDEVLLAKVLLRKAMKSKKTRRKLCAEIAGRVAAQTDGPLSRVSEIQIVTGTHDAVEYMTGRDTVGRERRRVRCEVKR